VVRAVRISASAEKATGYNNVFEALHLCILSELKTAFEHVSNAEKKPEPTEESKDAPTEEPADKDNKKKAKKGK
jgi:hypothetical protein